LERGNALILWFYVGAAAVKTNFSKQRQKLHSVYFFCLGDALERSKEPMLHFLVRAVVTSFDKQR
jgi:hypothetical protein